MGMLGTKPRGQIFCVSRRRGVGEVSMRARGAPQSGRPARYCPETHPHVERHGRHCRAGIDGDNELNNTGGLGKGREREKGNDGEEFF